MISDIGTCDVGNIARVWRCYLYSGIFCRRFSLLMMNPLIWIRTNVANHWTVLKFRMNK